MTEHENQNVKLVRISLLWYLIIIKKDMTPTSQTCGFFCLSASKFNAISSLKFGLILKVIKESKQNSSVDMIYNLVNINVSKKVNRDQRCIHKS